MDDVPSMAERVSGLTPVSGATLFRREIERRKRLDRKGVAPTGCSEIDDAVLLGGGFESGCVVGVSAEEMDFGLLLGLQTIARALLFEDPPISHHASSGSGGESKRTAAIITTLPLTTILPNLRDVIRSEAQIKLGPRNPGVDAELRRVLEAISISRVFDIEGLWEVLRELGETQDETESCHGEDRNEAVIEPLVSIEEEGEALGPEAEGARGSSADGKRKEREERYSTEADPENEGLGHTHITPSGFAPDPVTQLPPLRIGPELRQGVRKSEILDSEDEEPFSSSPLSSPPPSSAELESVAPSEEHPQPSAEPEAHPALSLDPTPSPRPQISEVPPPIPTNHTPPAAPDIILVTHFSSLLTTLFTHNDKASAHTNLQLLSSHLRHLAQSTESLIMLLNTTTSPPSEASTSAPSGARPFPGPNHPIPPTDPEATRQPRHLDSTLRSIFNPGPQLHIHGPGYPYGAAAALSARRNKPSFGATFAQFLDLHLLCTKMPRTRDDAETAAVLGAGSEDVKHAWVVEVLLDELGVWEWEKRGNLEIAKETRKDKESGREETSLPPRVHREQRWGAVDVRDRVRIVNAFADRSGNAGYVNRGPVRLAAGFGGPRV